MTTETQLPPLPSQPVVQKKKNTLGLVALITAIVGAIFAMIPGALIVGWVLLPIAFILSLIALFMADKKRGQAIAALIISIVGTVIGILVFIAVVGTAIDDAFSNPTEIQAPAGDVTNEADQDAAPHAESSAEPAEPATAEGTREKPIPLGTAMTTTDWEVTVNSVNLNATDAIMQENPFNDEPGDGNVYLMAEVTATYIGKDPEGASPFVSVEYVSTGGNSFASHDAVVVEPNAFDVLGTLYEGASTTGNIALEVPQDDITSGVLKVSPGMFADAVFVAVE